MRSNAKASSAGSSTHRAHRPGRVVRGADATRALSHNADRSGALSRRPRRAALSLAAALLALALLASSAFASKEVISDFGTFAGSGSFGGELNNPRDIAVNESGVGPANAGDAYVADENNNRIERFDSAGNFISAWGKDTIASSVNERQRIVIEATGGSFTLSFDGSTTAPISNPVFVANKLAALSTVGGGNVSVSGEGTAANPFVVTFKGALGGADQPTITADTSQLSGTVEISTIANGTSTVPEDTGTSFEICTVAAECQAGTASGENGALDHPQSVAVDQDTGNVYVSDRENRRIDEYDGDGNFIRSFGFDVAESGLGDTGTGYEVCNEAASDVCKSGEAGSGVGQYGGGFAGNGFGIAVSPADTSASSGTVYLADSGNRRVGTYDLDGTSPSSFGSSADFGSEQPRSVAVDSRGIVYASDSNNNGDVLRYDSQNANGGGVSFLAPIVPPNDERQEITFTGFNNGDSYRLSCPNGSPTEELTYTTGNGPLGQPIGREIIENGLKEACGAGNFSASGNPPNVTITFEGALAAANQSQMTCTVLSGTGSCSVSTTSEGHPGPLLRGEASSATAGLAVNPAGTALYVLRDPSSGPTVVQQFGPANAPGLTAPPTATDDAHGAAGGLSGVMGFGFDSTSGRLYVSATGDPDSFQGPIVEAHRVYVLTDSSALPSPTASMPSVGAVTDIATRTATFHGEVDPKGGLVGCKFQYSTDETNWTDVNAPGCAALSENGGVQNISRSVSGLVPDTHYSVRLQVTRPYFSSFTPVTSAVRSFTTASGPPVLAKASAKAVDEHSVRVTATIDPSHSPTTYVVQYGTSPALGSSTAPVSVGGGTQPIEVSPVIGGLSPATQYYFKVVATNLVGSTPSEELSVATFPSPPSFDSCSNDRYRTGPSAKLPDCRAYEQATPADKFGSDAYGTPYSVEASQSGDGITFYTLAGFPGGEGFQAASFFLSRFSDGQWSTAGLNSPPAYGDNAEVQAWTPGLGLSFSWAESSIGATGGKNILMRDSNDGSWSVLAPQSAGARWGRLAGAFDDDSKVVFEAEGPVPVTSGPAPRGQRNLYLYDRETEELTLAGLLPDSACASPSCAPRNGSEAPQTYETYVQDGHAVSSNGDLYFNDARNGKLYLRRDVAGPGASTDFVSASHKTDGPGGGVAINSPQPATFQGSTPDGSAAFFTSSEELTNESNTGPEPSIPPPPPTAIGRANLDGSGPQPNFIPTAANWITVDAGHVYWSNTEEGTISRAKINGESPEPGFITGLENPEGIALDSGHVYWAEARDRAEGTGTIGRADLDGSSDLVPGSIEKDFITGAGNPHGVAVSPQSASTRYVYWTNGVNTDVGRAGIDGESADQSFIEEEGFFEPSGIAVNATNLYWADNLGFVFKTNLEGGEENLEGFSHGSHAIAVDSNYVYWSEGTRVRRMSLDFSGVSDVLSGIEGLSGVAVDVGHLYWSASPPEAIPPASPGNDLYRYDAESGNLIDLAPDSADPNGAQVVGTLGYSDDGTSAYFAANGDLDGAGPAAAGNCAGKVVSNSDNLSGACSLYLWRADGAAGCAGAGGCVSFVTRLDAGGPGASGDGYDWAGGGHMKASRVSADGHTLVFRSKRRLTAYDNVPPNGVCGREEPIGTPLGCAEFYRYEAESGETICLTCNPTGAPPTGEPELKNPDMYHAASSHSVYEAQPFLSRNLSPDGKRFFFQTPDKLVPPDVNGEQVCPKSPDPATGTGVGGGPACTDVYEWEAPGTGSCTTTSGAYSPANGGCIYLLSTGTGPYPSYLADVSESGDTAFIFSRQQLVPFDEDTLEDLYAVKAGGGLGYQHAARPATCEGDACRGASSKPSDAPGAGSGVFEGPGNPKSGTNNTRCPKNKRQVRSKGKVRCVAKHAKHKKHKHAHKRAANNNRRASR